MATPKRDEIDAIGFEANLKECSDRLQEMVAYLRSTAEHSGLHVTPRRYKHSKPNTGWGITYYIRGKKFCEVHPKRNENHVWVFLQGADRAALEAEGFQPSMQDGWFKIRTMPEAVRIVNRILEAHDRQLRVVNFS